MQKLEYSGMVLSAEIIDKNLAAKMLLSNSCNRRLRRGIVDQYARDMLSGHWVAKPVPVCIDERGNLANGQHTLSAIVQSDTVQEVLVCRLTPRDAIAVMDRGLQRTITDVSLFLGKDMSGRSAAVARIMLDGPASNKRMSFDELWEGYVKHEEAITWAIGTNGTIPAAVFAVLARAWYTADKEMLARFASILRDGITRDREDEAAVRLRDVIVATGATRRVERIELYRKTEAALKAFLARKPLSKIYGIEEEQFPIPA